MFAFLKGFTIDTVSAPPEQCTESDVWDLSASKASE